ncbi:Uncharacterised protein [Mycobacteroides abscessus subsp. massiliense]|nr:Uncharacterised protein [Mycobacteroides abscessus subsp. massiliense]
MVRLLAAPGRATMRVFNDGTKKHSDTAPLTDKLPAKASAVYVFTKAETTDWIPFDFDTTRGTAEQVSADMAQAAEWVVQCGGVAVSDYNPSNGGRHLLVPLAHGTTASAAEMSHLMKLLQTRLPTLDISPATGRTEGCLTPPGSPTKKRDGHRLLDGPLSAAVEAFATRSRPELLPNLYVLLGAIQPSAADLAAAEAAIEHADYTQGAGDEMTLTTPWRTYEPYPADVEAFARYGHMNRAWPSRSEARMAVITAAIWRGHSLATIEALMSPGQIWHDGLGQAFRFDRDGRPRGWKHQLNRDFHKAMRWLINGHLQDRRRRHKRKDSPGGHSGFLIGSRGPQEYRAWLANSFAWADREFPGQRYRWTVYAFFQTTVFHALMGGKVVNGTPVVDVGGRSLALGSGLLSEHTMWNVAADVRDREGSPLMLVRNGLGRKADCYALTMQNVVETDPVRLSRARVEEVHTAWKVLGHHRRRIYELVAYFGLRNTADVFAAARVTASTGNVTINALVDAQLLVRDGKGTVALGAKTLDDIAAENRTEDLKAERIAQYAAERTVWWSWLDLREQEISAAINSAPADADTAAKPGNPEGDPLIEQDIIDSRMATGPPVQDWADEALDRIEADRAWVVEDEKAALALLGSQLGARIIAHA